MNVRHFYDELRRRNVVKVAAAYAIVAWLLIQIVTAVEEPLALPGWFDTAIIVFLGIGFPVSLIITWAFELTPDGLKKSEEVQREDSISMETGKKINRLAITSLSLVIILMAAERIFFAGSGSSDNTPEFTNASIAVLPFADMSTTRDQEYFSDGLSEELLNVLAKVDGIQVAGRTSSFQFKGQNRDLREVGSQLGVNHILEGSVRKSGNRLRITAQLIQADNGFHIWSETYDRTYSAENIFDIQDEISRRVLRELKVHLLPQEEVALAKLPTGDTEAYEAYLKGNQLLVNLQPEEIEEAITHFKRAIQLDPGFAAAYARLAIAYSQLSWFGNIDRDAMLKEMRSNIDQALLLNSGEGQAYFALGQYYGVLLEFDKAAEAFKKAHKLVPGDPEIMIWLSYGTDNKEQRSSLIKQAYQIDPLAPLVMEARAWAHYTDGEYDEALTLVDKTTRLHPYYTSVYRIKSYIMSDAPYGRLDEAFILAYRAFTNDPDNLLLIETLHEAALDLNMLMVMRELEDLLLENFPDNPSVVIIQYYNRLFSHKFNESIAVLDAYRANVQLDDDNGVFSRFYLHSYLLSNQLGEGRRYIEDTHPELFSDTLGYIPPYGHYPVAFTSTLYQKLGEDVIAGRLAKLVCENVENDFEYGGELKKEKLDPLWYYKLCTGLNGDVAKTLQIYEETYFARNSKADMYELLFINPVYDAIRDTPEFQDLEQRIEKDIQGMRNNAIAWLKAEGHWKPGWDADE